MAGSTLDSIRKLTNPGEQMVPMAAAPAEPPLPTSDKFGRKINDTRASRDTEVRMTAYQPWIDKYSKEYGVDPDLIKGVIRQESRGIPGATSGTGVRGLMQLTRATAKAYGVNDRSDPEQSIKGGTAFLADLLKQYNGDMVKSLAHYNSGGGAAKNLVKMRPEGQGYVQKILGVDPRTPYDAAKYTAAGYGTGAADTTAVAANDVAPPAADAPVVAPPAQDRVADAAPTDANLIHTAAIPNTDVAPSVGQSAQEQANAFYPPLPSAGPLKPVTINKQATNDVPLYFGHAGQQQTAEDQTAAAKTAMDEAAANTSTGDALSAAARLSHLAPYIMAKVDENASKVADPTWLRPPVSSMAKDLEMAGVPPYYMPRLEEAVSGAHYRSILSNIQQEEDASRTLGEAGTLRALGLTVAAGFGDPATFALNLTPFGWARDAKLAEGATAAGFRAKNLAAGAAIGAGVGIATEVPVAALSETQHLNDSIKGIAISTLLGGTIADFAGREAYNAYRVQEMAALRATQAVRDAMRTGRKGMTHELVPADIRVVDPLIHPEKDDVFTGQHMGPVELPPGQLNLPHPPIEGRAVIAEGDLPRQALPAPEAPALPGAPPETPEVIALPDRSNIEPTQVEPTVTPEAQPHEPSAPPEVQPPVPEATASAALDKSAPRVPVEGDTVMWTDKDGNQRTGTVRKKLDNGNFMVDETASERPTRVAGDKIEGGIDTDGNSFGANTAGAAQADRPSVYNLKDDIPEHWYEYPSAWGAKILRQDPVGWLKNRTNPVFKFFSRAGEDGVGINADGSAAVHSVEEHAEHLRSVEHGNWLREANHAFSQHDIDGGIGGRSARREKFMQEVADLYESGVRPEDMSAAHAQAVAASRRFFENYRKALLDADVEYARGLTEGRNYMPHVIDQTKFRNAVDRFGINATVDTLYGSLLSQTRKVAERAGVVIDKGMLVVLKHMAEGYVNGVLKRGTVGDMVGTHGFRLDDRATIKQLLDDAKIPAEKQDELLAGLRSATTGDSGPVRFKHRYDFDMSYVHDARSGTGSEGRLAMTDLFERNLDRLIPLYGRQVAGHVAFAREMGIKSRADFDLLVAKAKEEHAGSDGELRRGLKYMKYLYDAITGSPLESDPGSTLSVWGRRIRDVAHIQVMNQVGFAQAVEGMRVVTQLGLPAMLKQFPAFLELRKLAIDGKLSNGLHRELEAAAGIGTFRLRNQVYTGVSNDMEMLGGKLDEWLHKGKNLTSDISGMNFLTMVQQRMAAAGMAQRVADMVRKGKFTELWFKNDVRELASLGISREQAARIAEEMNAHAVFRGGTALHSLNLDQWAPEVSNNFIMGIHRSARRLVQENSYGTSNPFLHTLAGKFLFQFRSFMMNAIYKQTLHGLAMHDLANTMGFLTTTVMGGLSYMLQTSINETDQQKLNDRLELGQVALAGFNRAGYSSIIPSAVDTAINLGTAGSVSGLFTHARTTGQANDIFGGSASLGVLNRAARGIAAIPNLLRPGYQYSQADARAQLGSLPFNNAVGIKRGVNAIISDLPRESSKGGVKAYDMLFK